MFLSMFSQPSIKPFYHLLQMIESSRHLPKISISNRTVVAVTSGFFHIVLEFLQIRLEMLNSRMEQLYLFTRFQSGLSRPSQHHDTDRKHDGLEMSAPRRFSLSLQSLDFLMLNRPSICLPKMVYRRVAVPIASRTKSPAHSFVSGATKSLKVEYPTATAIHRNNTINLGGIPNFLDICVMNERIVPTTRAIKSISVIL